jgi:Zn-dependent membrane protease YugP
MLFHPQMLLFLAPAMLLAAWAQWRVHAAYQRAMQMPAPLSGSAAARHILDQAGLSEVPIELTPGHLSDHYDPSTRVVRLSPEVYHSRSLAAVGIAAHEVGHAMQHAFGYSLFGLRGAAVPAATAGPVVFMVMLVVGMLLHNPMFIALGIVAFSMTAVFQIINLPVEFDASARAKRVLAELRIVDTEGGAVVADVLGAAAWTYVAATLHSILQVLYYVMVYAPALFGGRSRDE